MESRVNLEKFVKVLLLCSIAVVGGFIIYNVFFKQSAPYINFGILNDEGQFGDYPGEVKQGSSFGLRYYIANNNPDITEFCVKTYLANSSSVITFQNGVENAEALPIYYHTVLYNESYTSGNISFTISTIGDNYRVCFELWVNNQSTWHYLERSVSWIWMNCTA